MTTKAKRFLYKTYWTVCVQFGFEVRKFFYAAKRLPRFFRDWHSFRNLSQSPINFLPCLHDWNQEAGSINNEYFWQDLYVARKIFDENPHTHVDVGSRLDGFVAHVATFRKITVFDIRPVNVEIPNVSFLQMDMISGTDVPSSYCDSVSCLHALEHFGLGRYGDPLDPGGHVKGFDNLVRLLVPGGKLYVSVPIGRRRVEFNAHRVLDPLEVLSLAQERDLSLCEFAWVSSSGVRVSSRPLDDMKLLRSSEYMLGIFTFTRLT